MSVSTSALRRFGVPGLAAVTLVAGLPLWLGSAEATHVDSPTITASEDGSVSAGACEPFLVTLPPTGTATTVGETVNVVLTATGQSATFNGGFCALPLSSGANTFTPAPGVVIRNGGAGANGMDENRYVTVAGSIVNRGEIVIGVMANQPTLPPVASTASTASTAPTAPTASTAPTAPTAPTAGSISGVSFSLNAYSDTDRDGSFTTGEPRQTGNTAVTVTAGGAGNAGQDNVGVVEVLSGVQTTPAAAAVGDDRDTAVQGETRTYRVYAGNNVGTAGKDPILGATITYVSDGSVVPFAPTFFGTTDNSGVATGNITFPVHAGDRAISFYVNRSTGSTNSLEAGAPGNEKFDSSAVTVLSSAPQQHRTVTLSPNPDADNPNNQSDPAVNGARDQDRGFTALVKAVGTAGSTNGTLLAFTVTGGSGDESVSTPEVATETSGAAASATLDPNDSSVAVTVSDPTPTVGQALTVTATVRGTSTTSSSALRFRNAPADARFVALSPKTSTVGPNTPAPLVATVTDVDGKPVAGVAVTFTETGAGTFRDRTSTSRATTNEVGQANTETLSIPGETGTQTITVAIDSAQPTAANGAATTPVTTTASQCSQPAGAGTDPQDLSLTEARNPDSEPAGVCADSSAVTHVAAAASPSATPTVSARPTVSPSPAVARCAVPAQVVLERSTITATGNTGVSVTGPANVVVDLLGYSRPSATYRVVRSGTTGADGNVAFTALAPPSNSRLYAQVRGCKANDVADSVVLNVRTALSLFATRNSSQNYTFSGDSLPARPGGLVVSLYRVTASGGQILTAQVRASASTGDWSIDRTFTGTGRFGFIVRTGQDLQNAPGFSNLRPTQIF